VLFEPARRLGIHRHIGPFMATISYLLEAAADATRLINAVELDPSRAALKLLAPLAAPRSRRQ
jgi:hypothetical protein